MGIDPYQRLLDQARLDEASGRRSRQRWMASQLVEDATFTGMLADLLDRGGAVTVRTLAGTTRTGRLLAVAVDHLVLQTGGAQVLVALAAVTDARAAPEAGHGPAATRRPAPLDRTLREALGRLAEDAPAVQVGYLGRAVGAVHGHLEAVGRDVVTVRPEDGEDRRVYVRIGAIAEVVSGG